MSASRGVRRSPEHVVTDIYPVGVLQAVQIVWRALTVPTLRGKRVGIVRSEVRRVRTYLSAQARAHNWRAVRNHFNGYLAEHDRCAHNAGRGWTKRAAERRVERICRRHIADALASLDTAIRPGETK